MHKSDKTLTLALVIPVYNEEHHIRHCLDAVMKQTVKPDEVIVVDNNSKDKTIEFAKKYKGVKIVKEAKQGLIAARNKGFETAKSDILCRIDADAILSEDWLETVRRSFQNDKNLSGVTGTARTRLLPRLPLFRTKMYANGYFWAVGGYYEAQVLWGANMAIRRDIWLRVRNNVCLDDKLVHEDQDLTLCILASGGKVEKVKNLSITTEGQVYHYFPKLHEYIVRTIKTREFHRQNGRWPVRPEVRYSKFNVWLRRITSALPGLFFYILSFAYWPLDSVMIRLHGDEKKWLEKNRNA